MAFKVTNDFTNATVLDADELNENFTNVETALNGGLTNESLSASANILNAQLQNPRTTHVLNFNLQGASAAARLMAASGVYFAIGNFPYDDTIGAETVEIESVTVFQVEGSATITTAIVGDLIHGTAAEIIAGSGFSTVISGITLGTATAAIDYDTGTSPALDVTSFVTSATPDVFAFKVTTQGVGYDETSSLAISIKLSVPLRS